LKKGLSFASHTFKSSFFSIHNEALQKRLKEESKLLSLFISEADKISVSKKINCKIGKQLRPATNI